MAYPASHLNYISIGSGPPLLMIHGNPATHTLWRPLVEPLAQEHTVYAIDLPGFGGSPQPKRRKEYSLQSLARIILDWADLQEIDRFDLIGHSFGGAVSVTIADMVPERVRSLVLIAPLGDAAPPAGRAAESLLMRSIATPLWKLAPGIVRRWIARRGARISYGPAFTKARAREISYELNRPQAIGSMTGVMRHVDYRAYRKAIRRLNDECTMPLLLLGAEHDRVIPFRHFERLRSVLTRAAYRVFPEGGHVLIWQYPAEIVRLISEFHATCEDEKRE